MPRIKERFARLTTRKMVSTTDWCGISVMASGTTVVSVAAAQAVSGAVIATFPVQATNWSSSGQAIDTCACSVANGSFIIFAGTSLAPATAMPIGWIIINQSR